ncbi:MAG: hypothetical protein J1G01_01235 [Clostridiales bacterium]|nr:hypothetical protein [Clostridiales bacterium]
MLYDELLIFSKDKIAEFFKNVTLFDNQFNFTEFHKICYENMYAVNNSDCPSTVKELKSQIQELAMVCKKCGPYYMNPRNSSHIKYDLMMGKLFEDILIDFFTQKLHIKAMHADNSNKQYPDCMILCGDKQIAAYFEVKYHSAPFISAINKINRYCYEGSITLDYKKIIKQLELIDSDIERPVFYLHWVDFPCLKGVFFETSEQIKQYIYDNGEEFSREKRVGDDEKNPKSIYLSKFYSPLLQMGTFEEFVELIRKIIKEKKHK